MSKPVIDSQFTPDIPHAIERGYYNMLQNTGRAAWRGMLAVAASGFGKGLLIAAAIIAVGSALHLAGLAYMGHLFFTTGAQATVGDGLFGGLISSLNVMAHGFGLAMLGIGGTLGAVYEVKKSQNRVTAETARAEEKQYELGRQLQQAQAVQPLKEKPIDTPDCNHCARELQRRAEPPETVKTL